MGYKFRTEIPTNLSVVGLNINIVYDDVSSQRLSCIGPYFHYKSFVFQIQLFRVVYLILLWWMLISWNHGWMLYIWVIGILLHERWITLPCNNCRLWYHSFTPFKYTFTSALYNNNSNNLLTYWQHQYNIQTQISL